MSALALEQFLAGCEREQAALPTQPPTAAPARPTFTSPPRPTDTRALAPTAAAETQASPEPTGEQPTPTSQPSPTPAAIPDLVVVHNGEPEQLVRTALKALGGIEQFVHPGDEVIVKPNICVATWTYEHATTTNPWVVGAIVKLCQEAGAGHVRVMDTPFDGTAEEAYVKSGIREQVEAAGGEMVYMPGYKYKTVEISGAKSLKKTDINDDVLKANVLINVPIGKDHSIAKLTLGMKNLMGVIRNRQAIHFDMGQRLADLTSQIRPALTIVDAVRILTKGGPNGGDLNYVKKLDTVIASRDIVAADSYASTLFGMQPSDLDYIVAGTAMGLGRSDLGSLRIEELNVA